MQKFISLAELSREAGIPTSRIIAAVEEGLIQPAGRAGRNPNSPIIFLSADVANIVETLATAGRMKATATAPRPPVPITLWPAWGGLVTPAGGHGAGARKLAEVC